MAYRIFQVADAIEYARIHSGIFASDAQLHSEEIGDGNLNLVFRIVDEQGNSVVVKQALPYARCVGESWPLTIDRARIEAEVMLEHAKYSPAHIVKVLKYDPTLAVMILEDLSDHQIWRYALIARAQFANVGKHLGSYLANVLFHTSDLALPAQQKKAMVKQFTNPELCQITEDLFFTDPLMDHERNNFEAHQNAQVKALWQDQALKAAFAALKADFLSKPQALLHGDVHSGSVFAKAGSTVVIDAEFGFFGPIGFDVGSVIGNLLLNQARNQALADGEMCAYIETQLREYWAQFSDEFSALMVKNTQDPAFNNSIYQQRLLKQIWVDSVGYAGAELIRRTVGLAHVKDLDSIDDVQLRAKAQHYAVSLGRELAVNAAQIEDMQQLVRLAFELSNA